MRELRDLSNSTLITMSKKEARALIEEIGANDWDNNLVSVALDCAQGEEVAAGRYVIIYVEP